MRQLALREQDGIRRIAFRVLRKNASVEHVDLLLSRGSDGRVVAADVHLLSTGEMLSDTVRRVILPVLSQDTSLLGRLRPIDRTLIQHWTILRTAQQKLATGRAAEAAGLVESLPEAVRSQKFALLLLVRAAAESEDDARYQRALEELIRRFPGDPAASVAAIDYHFMRKEFDKQVADLERLQTTTVPDPYLDALLANALREAGRASDAVKVAQQAVEREPDLQPAHSALVEAAFSAKDFASARRALLRGREQFGGFFDIETLPEFAQFMKSPEGAAFRREARE